MPYLGQIEASTYRILFYIIEMIGSTSPRRFVAIKDPLRYHTIMNQMRMMKMVGSCWITVIVATLVKDAIVWNFSDGPRYLPLKL